MDKVAIVIPAQEHNRHYADGDLVEFGDTNLLEWKISQCKEVVDSTSIYVSSASVNIKKIAENCSVNFLQRNDNVSYNEMLVDAVSQVEAETIVWANVTAPFISTETLRSMLRKHEEVNCGAVISVSEQKEYVYFRGKCLNFDNSDFVSRENLDPVFVASNGFFVAKKNDFLSQRTLFVNEPTLYSVSDFEALEIKDASSLKLANELIALYFTSELVN